MYNFRNQLLMKIEWIQLESVQKKLLMRLLKPQIWNLMIQLNVIITFKNYVFFHQFVLKTFYAYLILHLCFFSKKKKKKKLVIYINKRKLFFAFVLSVSEWWLVEVCELSLKIKLRKYLFQQISQTSISFGI